MTRKWELGPMRKKEPQNECGFLFWRRYKSAFMAVMWKRR